MTPDGQAAPHKMARRAAEHPLPPPYEAPLADNAPVRLTAWIYLVMRDLLPPRYLDHLAAHVQDWNPAELDSLDPGLRDYAERMARRLIHGYGPTEDGQ